MKGTLIFLLFLFSLNLVGQSQESKKPDYVIIIGDEIVSPQKVAEYGEKGFIKSINKGVSEEVKKQLAQKFGEKIGEKEFIVIVTLLSEEERLARKKHTGSATSSKKVKAPPEFRIKINDAAPDFKVSKSDGSVSSLSQQKGKVVLLNFWATWCAPCIMEFYDMPTKILEPLAEQDFIFLPIAIGEDPQQVMSRLDKLKEDGIVFDTGFDPHHKIWNLYANGAIPKNILIDQKGGIRYLSTGYSEDNLDKLASEIKKLLEK